MGGKRMAMRPRKMSLPHMLLDGLLTDYEVYIRLEEWF
jgi:hypothetical protein